MKISYYPGCTLKATAQNFEGSALASLAALGIEVEELPRWNCCGAVTSLATDDLVHQLAPTRVLIRAQEAGADQVMSLCSQCYNTLARANQLVREHPDKLETLNQFMDEEPDYLGQVESVHFLQVIRDAVGWDGLRAKVTRPLEGLKIAPYYGCTLLRPEDVSIDGAGKPRILLDFISALGATPVDFPLAEECCSAFQVVGAPEASQQRAQQVVRSAADCGVDALILSCPLCDYNLGKQQETFVTASGDPLRLPVFYFTQLLALALGVEAESCRFELNQEGARALLEERNLVTAGA